MAYKFDENKYKSTFDQMYGKGSFDKGLAQAREIGRSKVEADLAQKDYNARLSAAKKAASKKTYDDAVSYWNNPANKDNLMKKGVYRTEQEIRNNPHWKQLIKDRGYTTQDFIDGMYAAGTNGQARSSREYNQQRKSNNQNVPAKADSLIPMVPDKTSTKKTKTAQNYNLSDKQLPLIPLTKKKTKKLTLKDDLKNLGRLALDTINPFDNVDAGQALKNYAKAGMSDTYKEIQRGANRAVDSASFGVMSNLDKKMTGKTPDYLSKRKAGEGGVTDFVTTGLGYLVPGVGEYKLLNGMKAGKALTQFGTKGLSQRLASESAKGAVIGAGLSIPEVAVKESLNPKDQNWKDNLKYIGTNTALGAVSDPLLYGIGKGFSKGMESASNNTIKKLLPNQEELKKALTDVAKSHKAENALPVKNKNMFDNLLPKGNDITKPNYVPKLTPGKSLIPQIGKPTSLPPIENLSLPERLQLINKENRQMPDFSFGKPVTEQPGPKVNVYGVEVPKGDLVESATPQYWQKRYEDFTKYVKDSGYNENNLSVDAINELWTHFAKPDEPSLDKVIDLAYTGYKEPKVVNAADVWDKLGNRQPVSKNAKNLLMRDLKPSTKPLPQNLLPEVNVNRAVQEPQQSLIPNVSSKVSDKPFIPLETPVRTQQIPSSNLKERGHIETLRNSQNSLQALGDAIKGMYKPTTNEEAVAIANKYLAQGAEKATSFVKSAKVLKPEHVATAHRLIQEFQRTGQIEKAVDIAEHIAERGTKAGQAVQAFSIFDRLSPEGILVHANRVADRANAKLSPLQEKVTITPDTAAQLTDLATTVQKMTQQKTVANDVINLMDRAKAGEKLSTEETKQIRQFVDDAKQWINDITPKKTKPKAPNKIISPAVKEQVVSFLDKQEEAARKRLAARKGRALSGLPVDDFYDYAVIGASKLAKGTMNLADFSEQMIREFGQEVAPHIQQIYDKASEMVNSEVKRTVNRLSEVEKITNKAIKNGKLEETEAENLRKFALSINNLSGDAKIEASQELQAVLQGLERPSLLQKISTAQTIGQLLNPKTLARNAIGNELFYRLERINKIVATPIDIARSKITGGQRTVTFRTNNQAEYWKNWLRGAKAGWKGVNPEGLSTQYDLYPNSFSAKWNPYTYFEKALGASLKSFDYAGYKRAVNNTIGELATLRAVNEGLSGQARKQAIEKYIREADENILGIADQYGKYMTFQDNNAVSTSLQSLKRWLNKHTTGSHDFGAGDLILKYPKTPGSLLLRGLEYSPIGFLKSLYQIGKPILTKGEAATTREITETLTRALVGTGGIAAPAYVLADLGILTGGGSKDLDVKDLEKSVGKQDYSLNITGLKRWVLSGFDKKQAAPKQGDQFISYNWAQPIALSVAMAANVAQSVKQSGETNMGGAIVAALDGALDSMVGLSVLQGVQRALTTYPGQSLTDKALDVAGQLPASFIPTAWNQVRQLTDNTSRNVYDPLKLKQFGNQARNKIPGAELKLPPSYDTLGNKKEMYQGGSNNLFNVLLNPAFVSRYNPSPEAEMTLNVIRDTGDESLAPRRAQKYLIVDGKKYDLSSQQYAEYQRRLGTEVKTQLQHLNPNLPSDTLGASISKILDKSGRKVREELKQEFYGYNPKK